MAGRPARQKRTRTSVAPLTPNRLGGEAAPNTLSSAGTGPNGPATPPPSQGSTGGLRRSSSAAVLAAIVVAIVAAWVLLGGATPAIFWLVLFVAALLVWRPFGRGPGRS